MQKEGGERCLMNVTFSPSPSKSIFGKLWENQPIHTNDQLTYPTLYPRLLPTQLEKQSCATDPLAASCLGHRGHRERERPLGGHRWVKGVTTDPERHPTDSVRSTHRGVGPPGSLLRQDHQGNHMSSSRQGRCPQAPRPRGCEWAPA